LTLTGRGKRGGSLASRASRLAAKISEVEELADALAFDVAELESHLQAAAVPRGRGKFRRAGHLTRSSPAAGAARLRIGRGTDGFAEVAIDRGTCLLPPTMADLLEILGAEAGAAADEFVGWKTLAEVAAELDSRFGRALNRHAVINAIYRLRRLLRRSGLDPRLVQTHPRCGARLALRRQKDVTR
jgi:hypothetical protein